MIKVSVMYPRGEGSHFDIDYYCNQHMRLVRELIGAPLQGVNVDEGIGGLMPGSASPHHAVGHLFFESVEAFQEAFAPHVMAIIGDIPNFTNCQPLVQVNAVRM